MESPILATDTVVFNVRKGELKVLLIKMNREPYIGKWALPGGVIGVKELAVDAASRILYEATSVSDLYLEQLRVFDDLDRDTVRRAISIAYMALIKKDDLKLKTDDRYTDIAWFPVNKLPELAFDHKEIIEYAFERLKGKVTYSTIALSLMPDKFTLSELQEVFEIILGKELDKRNFRKKLLKLGVIEDTGEKRTIGTPRPASLFKAVKNDLEFIEMI